MTTKISEANIQDATLANIVGGGGGPKISSIIVTDSSYVNLDDTAVALEGGYVKLIGSGFAVGCQVLIGLTPVTSVTFISDTEVRAQVPATAAGTYIVYLVNADGGTAIRINAVTFSGTPTWVSGSALAGAAETAISIQLTATGATTFALAAGSTLPPGVSLSSGGLLSGTITGITQETVYNFTINAVDAELQDSPRSFAFTVTSGDQYFNLTTLLLPGSATTFVQDASSNNFAVAVAGDTRPNTFNPYLTGWSNQFDGTGDYLAVPINSTFAFGTSNYTYEAWVYPFAFTNDYNTVFCNFRDDQGLIGWSLLITNNGLIHVNNQGTYNNSTNAISLNTWTHIAVCRIGNTVTRYINGIADPTLLTISASITNPTSQGITIGGSPEYSSGTGRFWNGYISNARVISGTAIYTTNFTPSTTPFAAVAGTSLLTCQSNRFADNSANNFAITRNGDVAVRSFSPFLEPQTTNGSGYFDGNGDYLTVSANAALDFGTGDFTVEAWVYPINNGQLHPTFLGSITGWSAGASGHRFNNTGYANKFWFGLNGSGGIASGDPLMVSNNTFSFNTWHHYAITRTGNTFRMFVNGVLENTQTFTGSYNAGLGGLRSGWSTWDGANGYWTGSISNLRLVKGTALYTAAFTPPTAPLTAVANTSLLTLQNNTPVANNTFLDSSTNNLLVTRAGNATQGTFSPYSPSGWSNYFDGTGDYLNLSANTAFNIFDSDMTVECWFYATALTNSPHLLAFVQDSTNRESIYFASSALTFWSSNSSGNGARIATAALSLNTWYHMALVKSGSTFTLYLDGTSVGTSTTTQYSTSNQSLQIGTYNSASYAGDNFNGYISNLRIVKGTALYTTAFTPPTAPLTAVAGTSLLTCQSSGFADLSPNRLAVTRAGDVRVTNFAPFKAVVQTPVSYSAYFDGTGDFITVGSTAVTLPTATTPFTMEAWVYITAFTGVSIISTNFVSGAIPFMLGLTNGTANTTTAAGGYPVMYYYTGSAWNYLVQSNATNSTQLSLNTWYHIAGVYTGSAATIYVNGTATVTAAQSTWPTTASAAGGINVGRKWDTSTGAYFSGYISNARLVIGTALYTSNFTPSTTPLTAIANTSLLTCQSPTFVDNSTNNFAITAAGNSQPTTVNPFGSTFTNSTGYSAAEYSGSMRFDGTGDYLQTTLTNSALGTNNFTIEGWFYWTGATNNNGLFQLSNTAGGFTNTAGTLCISIYFGNILLNVGSNGSSNSTGVAVPTNQWTHFAIVRSSSVSRFYLNGTLVSGFGTAGAQTDTTNYSSTFLGLGGYYSSSYLMTGYISNFRIVKGTAIYTSNFVPPIAPVQPVPNTVLLLNGTSAAVTDATTRNVLETVGNAQISTAQSKFGGSSIAFDGTGDYIQVPTSANLAFGTGAFTIEMWLNRNTSGDVQHLIDFRGTNNNDYNPVFYWQSNNFLYYTNNNTSGDNQIQTSNAITSSSGWVHLALVRSGTTLTIYVNGIASGSVSYTTDVRGGNPVFIGSRFTIDGQYNGYIDDLRITRGTARYTANFTPPATAFQTR